MKKLLAILLSLSLLFGFTACGNSESTGKIQDATGGANMELETTQPSNNNETTAPATPDETNPTTPTETTPAVCTHSFTDATCTAPKTCTLCGVTEGNPAEHTWKDATCTAPKTCTNCSAAVGHPIGHDYKNATCTAPKTCSKCSATEGNSLGHDYVEATCTRCQTTKLTDTGWYLICVSVDKEIDEHGEIVSTSQWLDDAELRFSPNGKDGSIVAYYWSEKKLYANPERIEYNGHQYYDAGFGRSNEINYTIDGDMITITEAYASEAATMTLKRTGDTTLEVVAVQGHFVACVEIGQVFTTTRDEAIPQRK